MDLSKRRLKNEGGAGTKKKTPIRRRRIGDEETQSKPLNAADSSRRGVSTTGEMAAVRGKMATNGGASTFNDEAERARREGENSTLKNNKNGISGLRKKKERGGDEGVEQGRKG